MAIVEAANVAGVDWSSMINSGLPNAQLILDSLAFGGGGDYGDDYCDHPSLAYPMERCLLSFFDFFEALKMGLKANEGLT